MAYNLEQGTLTLKKTIKGKLTHRDYKRVCEIADKYTKYVTGENIESLLRQFVPRENDKLFEQRKALTQAVTSYMASMIMSPMYKVGRTRADQSITWSNSDKADEKKKDLTETVNSYYGDESVESYMTSRMVELDSTDPNTFIITEASGSYDPLLPISDTNKKLKPYPFEVNSTEAINYLYKNNQLEFFIAWNEFAGPIKNDKQLEFNKYTLYLENEAVIATQIHKDDLDAYILTTKQGTYEVFYTDENNKDKCDIYILTIVEYKLGRIPARRVGTKKDLTTRGRTCVPMMHAAQPFFEKSIKTVSEFDLANCLHLFPQKIQYNEVCPGDIEKQQTCSNGKSADGGICSVCSGSGWKIHLSAADVINVKFPKNLDNGLPSLENYMAYKGPDIELLKFMKDLGLYEFPNLAIKAVYISELYTTDTVASTATEKNIDLESVYDTLKPFADNWSAMWKHILNVIASYRDAAEKIVIVHQFPKDFKMKSVTMLLEDLSKANTSGAPSYIKNQINKDLTDKIYIDSPNELQKINVKNKFFPFNGKSESEINNIIVNDLCTKYKKVLYANFDSLFDELETEYSVNGVQFYNMEQSKIQGLLKTKVDAIITELDQEGSNDRAAAFDTANLGG